MTDPALVELAVKMMVESMSAFAADGFALVLAAPNGDYRVVWHGRNGVSQTLLVGTLARSLRVIDESQSTLPVRKPEPEPAAS